MARDDDCRSKHPHHAIDGHMRNLNRVLVRSKNLSLRWALVAALGFTLVAAFAAAAGDAPPEPDSYRQSDYRAPTPASLKGARVLSTDEASAMGGAGGAGFIDG